MPLRRCGSAPKWDPFRTGLNRVVAKIEWHQGELYPRVGFIVTNLARPAERVVAFYNQRGTTARYTQVATTLIADTTSPLDRLSLMVMPPS
jgi:hypothetical protein